MSMVIKLDPMPGCSIETAFDKAKNISIILQITCELLFNGVTCLVHHNSDKHKFIDNFHKSISSDREHKYAI